MDGDGEVGRESPRGRRPNGERGTLARAVREREFNKNRRRDLIHVFDFCFGESGLGTGAPENRFFASIDETFFDKAGEGPEDRSLVGRGEGEVGIFPIAEHAETAELFALDIDKASCVGFRFFADFERGEAGGGFDDFEFDGEAVAVPSRDKGSVEARHGFRFYD